MPGHKALTVHGARIWAKSRNLLLSSSQIPHGLNDPESGWTLADLYQLYHGVLWEEGFHKYCVNSFIAELNTILGADRFIELPQGKLDFLIGILRSRGNSNATINRKLAALQKLLRKAFKMGDIHNLPEFRRQKERAGRIRFVTQGEERVLFAAIRKRNIEAYLLCTFLVDTGARLGEALGLKWADANGGRATFWITKSGRSRTVPLTRRAQAALEAQQAHIKGPFQHVYPHQFRAIWNEAKAEIGLSSDKDLVPHVLRHTCASRLVQGGIDIRRVQMWLGHQTLQMTMRYAHLATHDLDKWVVVLEQKC